MTSAQDPDTFDGVEIVDEDGLSDETRALLGPEAVAEIEAGLDAYIADWKAAVIAIMKPKKTAKASVLRRPSHAPSAGSSYVKACPRDERGHCKPSGSDLGDKGTSHEGYAYLALPRAKESLSSAKIRKAADEGTDITAEVMEPKAKAYFEKVWKARKPGSSSKVIRISKPSQGESWFKVCPRDSRGKCLPKGGADESKGKVTLSDEEAKKEQERVDNLPTEEKLKRRTRPPADTTTASELYQHHKKQGVLSVEQFRATLSPETRAKVDEVERRLATTAPPTLKDATGKYLPERRATHEEIILDALTPERIAAATPASGTKPLATMLGGRGGSGKGGVTKSGGAVDKGKAIYINSDDVLEKLPGYEGWNAALYQEESSVVASEIERVAKAKGLNVILDTTMRTPRVEKVKKYNEAGYDVKGVYVYAPPDVAARRAVSRYETGGRYVPASYIIDQSTTNEESFDEMKEHMATWEVWDNSHDRADGPPRRTASGGKRK